jgi:exonuclease III
MKFGTWNVRRLYRAGSLTAASRESAKYKLDLVGVQEVRWEKEGKLKAGDYNFFLWKRKRKSSIGKRIFVHHRIVSIGKRIFCTPQNCICS